MFNRQKYYKTLKNYKILKSQRTLLIINILIVCVNKFNLQIKIFK